MLHVEEYYKSLALTHPVAQKRVYIATDEPKIFDEARRRYVVVAACVPDLGQMCPGQMNKKTSPFSPTRISIFLFIIIVFPFMFPFLFFFILLFY